MNSLLVSNALMKSNLLTRLRYNDLLQNNTIWKLTVCRWCSQGVQISNWVEPMNFLKAAGRLSPMRNPDPDQRKTDKGKMVEKTVEEPNFIKPDRIGPSVEKHVLSKFQKRLLYTCGKYPSMEAVPNFAGESELRNATDVCKTLFNLWCMMFLAFFFIFIHFIEKRRMRRMFARATRREEMRMREFDIINKEAQEKKIKRVSVAS